jgi:hypothetical protein
MADSENKALVKPNFISEKSEMYSKLQFALLEKIESASNNEDLELFIKFAKSLEELADSEQLRYFALRKEEEALMKARTERKLGVVKDIAKLLFGFVFVGVGFYLSFGENAKLGVFLISTGFVALGLSTGLVDSIINRGK